MARFSPQVLTAAFSAFLHIHWALLIDVQRGNFLFLLQICKRRTWPLILFLLLQAQLLFPTPVHPKVRLVDWLLFDVFFSWKACFFWLRALDTVSVNWFLLRRSHCKCIMVLSFVWTELMFKILELRHSFSLCGNVTRVVSLYLLPFLCLFLNYWTSWSWPNAWCLLLDVNRLPPCFRLFKNNRF